jgi:hypothetical protein
LLDVGLSHRQTVVLIYAICIALGLLSLFLTGPNQLQAFAGVFVVIGLVLYALARVRIGGSGPGPDVKGADPDLRTAGNQHGG